MALLDGWASRVEQRSMEIAHRMSRMAEVALAEFPDISLHREGDELVLSGRGLMRRWLSDIRLRFAFWKGQ
jgi:hypothetical protein